MRGEPTAELGLAPSGRPLQVAQLRPRRPAPGWTLASTQAGDARGPICPTSGTIPALQRAARLPEAPEGKEACPERAGWRGSCIKSAGGAAVRASFAVCHWDRECRGKATAKDRALRSGYPMLGLPAAAARAICWSSRTAKRSRHTAAWAGSQRCLSL